ncbi:hypothetical protein [Methylibium sp.]|uniref:hypothetical protein n=1 Tax=Methylibium sp. TaxID=2067992 RepID=UPI003D144BF0
MTPQSHFTVVAPLAAGREPGLRELLASMNTAPGVLDPRNAVLRFGEFESLHFARLVILDDPTLADLEAHGAPAPRLPKYLALIGDCDGPARAFLADLARRAGDGLRRLFAHCAGFEAGGDLLAWMLARDLPVAALYVNWVGRTVQQIRQESALQALLATQVPRAGPASGADAQRIRRELIARVEAEVRSGRLALTPAPPTPLPWRLARLAHVVTVPLVGLLVLPLLVVLLPLLIHQLRTRERNDPEVCPRPEDRALRTLQDQEDRDVTNQYTALGLVKPGRFRRWLLTVLLVLVDYAARHVYTRGYLARVQTIHFARWVFLDGKSRVLFMSNYDGNHQSYMDDFINKAAWGLNLLFSNGVGWPRTRWLILGGARIEQRFKHYQRRHQLPTQVWYKAYPGLALADLRRNQRIREGLERSAMSDAQALAWLRLL